MKPIRKWIEDGHLMSPPARGRGLKQSYLAAADYAAMSPPARGRGLKRRSPAKGRRSSSVAPRAGAWIETDPNLADPKIV